MINPEIKFIENADRKGNRRAEHKLDTSEANIHNWKIVEISYFSLNNNEVHYGTYQRKIHSQIDKALLTFVGISQQDGRTLEGQ